MAAAEGFGREALTPTTVLHLDLWPKIASVVVEPFWKPRYLRSKTVCFKSIMNTDQSGVRVGLLTYCVIIIRILIKLAKRQDRTRLLRLGRAMMRFEEKFWGGAACSEYTNLNGVENFF